MWLWGLHAVEAVLANPDRSIQRLLVSENAAQKLTIGGHSREVMNAGDIARHLPAGAVHQGAALLADAVTAYRCTCVRAGRA